MHIKRRKNIITSTKVAFIQIKAAFFASVASCFLLIFLCISLPSCSPVTFGSSATPGSSLAKLKAKNSPVVLGIGKTHSAFKKWRDQGYQNTDDHKITFKSHHPDTTESTLPEIISGYSINRLSKRSEGIGLPALITARSGAGHIFTPITAASYISNLRPANILATQSVKDGILHTHFDIYHPYDQTHKGQALKRQPNIIMQYITDLPGNSALDIKGLIRPTKYGKHQGFYLAEPYDKKRIPILMIHGLISSPATYAEMSDAINADPKLRNKYQLWYYFYPTGTPWLVTASKFRNSYRELIKALDPDSNDSNLRKTTIIAHSMGGLITRLSLSTPENTLQQAYFGNVQLEKTVKDNDLKKIKEYFHFQPLTEPKRVIYLATPHRGSRIATSLIGSLAIRLISIPGNIIKQTADVLATGQLRGDSIPEQTRKLLTKGESSINQLQAKNPSLKALNQMQPRKNLTSYSVIGDIGAPLMRLKTDGVVSHSSSRLSHSKEEITVPSNHDICGEDETIEAVIYILSK